MGPITAGCDPESIKQNTRRPKIPKLLDPDFDILDLNFGLRKNYQ